MTSTAFGPLPPSGAEPLESFEIHRRGWLYVAVVIVPLLLAGGYGWVAYDRGELLWAGVAGVLMLVGLSFVPTLRDLRAPLLVADEHGVRLQGDQGWIGLLWSEIESISVRPSRGLRGARLDLLADGSPEPYGVPLGLVTDCPAGQAQVELARRRAVSRA
ncbi:MAG TPA: hypothetical protein VNZ66_07555 [Aeromicrobium sp.]|nr:hypothetical protein [Aeromicrobium sp.]